MSHKPEDPDETRRWEAEKRGLASTRKVEIDIDPTGKGTCIVDGHDVSRAVQSISFVSHAGDATSIELHLGPRAYQVRADAQVEVSDPTVALLLSLGWTPPGGAE